MPTRPALHQPSFAKTPDQRARDERERQRIKDAERPSSSQRGYDREWRELRAGFIVEHPVCSVPGCGGPTVDVDHVEDVRAHPERRLDPSNLRPYCHRHHAQRTARDQGFARRREDRGGPRVSTRAALYPDWLRPSRVPLQIVCGAPASGKSTYAAERASFTELVLDLDDIKATLSGLPVYQPGRTWRDEAIRHRNSELGNLSAAYPKLGGAWLIVGEPTPEKRLWWRIKLRPLSIIVLATPAEVCHARIDADPRRDAVRDLHHAAVDAWWRDYCPMSGDRTIAIRGRGRLRRWPPKPLRSAREIRAQIFWWGMLYVRHRSRILRASSRSDLRGSRPSALKQVDSLAFARAAIPARLDSDYVPATVCQRTNYGTEWEYGLSVVERIQRVTHEYSTDASDPSSERVQRCPCG